MTLTKELKILSDNVENDLENQDHTMKSEAVSPAPEVGHLQRDTEEGKPIKILLMGSLDQKIQEV